MESTVEKIKNVAYVHSKICDAIITAAHDLDELPISGIIYARGYRGFSSKASLYLRNDTIFSELELLSYAFFISQFYASIQADKIRIIIPHDYVIIMDLLCSHEKVSEVLYIEEGDLSYSLDQHIHKSEIFQRPLLSDPIENIIRQLGFKCNEIRWQRFKPTWFSDAFGKYRGVIASNSAAFESFSGSRMIINIPSLDIFPAETSIILIQSFLGPEQAMSKILVDNSIDTEAAMIHNALSKAFMKYFENAVQWVGAKGQKIVVKAHPLLNSQLFKNLTSIGGNECVPWDETDLEYVTRKTELGHVNFSKFCIIGNTSCMRYLLERRQDTDNLLLINNEEIAITGLSFLLEEMEEANRTASRV